MAPVVSAFQAMRGVRFVTAATIVAEAGDLRRFEHPRWLMAFLGLLPSERSTGDAVFDAPLQGLRGLTSATSGEGVDA